MKTVWKWILGIVVLLIVVAVGVAAWARQNGGLTFAPPAPAVQQAPEGPGAPYSPEPGQDPRGPRRIPDWRHAGPMDGPVAGREHLMPFAGFFLFRILMQVIPLMVLALLLIAAYQFGVRAGTNRASNPKPAG